MVVVVVVVVVSSSGGGGDSCGCSFASGGVGAAGGSTGTGFVPTRTILGCER